MTTKVIELKDTDGNILLPHAYSASHDNNGDAFSSVYATITTVNTKADDSAVVHLSGNEVITGIKTINVPTAGTNLIFKSNLIDTSTTPEENIYHHIDYRDKNDNLLARIFECRDIYGANVLALQTWNGSTQHWIGVNSSGYGVAPTPSDASDNSTKIATTAWVNNHIDVNPNVVRTTGSQSILGEKTFCSNNVDYAYRCNLNMRNVAHVREEALNQDEVAAWSGSIQLGFSDKTTGWFENYCRNGLSVTSLVASTTAGDETAYYSSIRAIANGSTLYTYAPPSAVANSILTTLSVNKHTNGFLKLGNGLIIQHGYIAASSNQNPTITMPTAFTNTDYIILFGTQRNGNLSDGYAYYLGSVGSAKTTTSFNMYLDTPGYVTGCYWLAFGY